MHCPSDNGLIPHSLLEPHIINVPVPKGSVVFLHRLTKHASLPNLSDRIRWSFDLRYQPIGQPTGRAELPGFVVRSKENPQAELKDHIAWAQLWYEARDRLVAAGKREQVHRWDGDLEVCA